MYLYGTIQRSADHEREHPGHNAKEKIAGWCEGKGDRVIELRAREYPSNYPRQEQPKAVEKTRMSWLTLGAV
jgi:hypothetical protein